MSQRKPKKSRGAPGPPSSPRDRLFQWAKLCFNQERAAIAPRLAIAGAERFEEFRAAPLVGGLGMEGLLQAAAVLARSAQEDELVAVLAKAQGSGDTDTRSGL